MEEHFSEPEPNVIASSAGFAVRVLGRTGMRYLEGGRSVWIDSEVLATARSIAMHVDSMKAWENPHDSAEFTEADRDRIADNIKRAFDACGYHLQVQRDKPKMTEADRQRFLDDMRRTFAEAGRSDVNIRIAED